MKGGPIPAGRNRLYASRCAARPLLRGKRRHAGEHLALEELERCAAAGGDVAHLRRLALLPGIHNIHPVIIATKEFLYLLRHVLIQFVCCKAAIVAHENKLSGIDPSNASPAPSGVCSA